MAEKVLKTIGILLNDLKRNSSGGNQDKQNEDVESVMARLYPSGRGQCGERKRPKKFKNTSSCRRHIFYQNKENQPRFRLVLREKDCGNANCKITATRQMLPETNVSIPRQEKISRGNLKNILTFNLGILAVF